MGSQAVETDTAYAGSPSIVSAQATVTITANAGAVRLYHRLPAYDLDSNNSQALNIPIQLSGVLLTNPAATVPSRYVEAKIRARRLSLVMPTPTLDSNGRPT